jgi:hypothetical protein
MTLRQVIRVLYASKAIGGFKGREGMNPVCHSCDKSLGKARAAESKKEIPPEALPLVFAAESASEQLGATLEIVDVSRSDVVQRLKERLSGKPLPRIVVGSDYIAGAPTIEEVIRFFHRSFPPEAH